MPNDSAGAPATAAAPHPLHELADDVEVLVMLIDHLVAAFSGLKCTAAFVARIRKGDVSQTRAELSREEIRLHRGAEEAGEWAAALNDACEHYGVRSSGLRWVVHVLGACGPGLVAIEAASWADRRLEILALVDRLRQMHSNLVWEAARSMQRLVDELAAAPPRAGGTRKTRMREWQAHALSVLLAEPAISGKDLAHRVGVSPATISRNEWLKRMRASNRAPRPHGSTSASEEAAEDAE